MLSSKEGTSILPPHIRSEKAELEMSRGSFMGVRVCLWARA